MYSENDPRSALAKTGAKGNGALPAAFAPAQYGKFYDTRPEIDDASGKSWITRGETMVVVYTEGNGGGVLSRADQCDEYAFILPDPEMSVEVTTAEGTVSVPGYSVAFVPPGASSIRLTKGGRIARLFTSRSADLARQASNAEAYERPYPAIPPFRAWPEPPGGLKLRWYSLDVPVEPGRFGRIFRCTTIMVNYLDPRVGPRERNAVSPHHHDDFEQYSLALDGSYAHHIRWPWTTDMNAWREDEHVECHTPSVCVIPPPAIHTSTSEGAGVNQLVDIFSPPRPDFSSKAGWVLNETDYPMPE